MLCLPHRLVRNAVQQTAVMSSGFYVDPSIRGAGLQIFLTYRALSTRYALYATTANAVSERLWRSAGGKPLDRTDYELLRPIAWPGAIEDVLVLREACLKVVVAPAIRRYIVDLLEAVRARPEVVIPASMRASSGGTLCCRTYS